MDIVFITGLQVETLIGIYDWERKVRQTVSFDLEMAYDLAKAATTDDITFALDYKKVSDRVAEFVHQREFLLLESMGERVAQMILSEFAVPWLRLRLHKPGAVPEAKDVGIVIERSRG